VEIVPVNLSVYCHVSPNGKMYIGISLNPIKRWSSGNGYKNNQAFYDDIQEYGWDAFEHVILYSDLTIDEAKRIEADLIKQWQLTDSDYGYNLRDGGDGSFSERSRQKMSLSRLNNKNSVGNKLSDETKKKISLSLKEYYSCHTGTFYGKHHSPKTIEILKGRKISDDAKRKMSENHRDITGSNNPSARRICQFSLDGKLIAEYPYASMASRQYNLDLSSIIKCCRSKQKTCGGYVWKYADNVGEAYETYCFDQG
jgi:group I intron endonuclease